jgi:hypothetical protein
VDIVDDEDIDGTFSGVEMKSKLFLQGGEEGRKRSLLTVEGCIVGLPAEVDVEAA